MSEPTGTQYGGFWIRFVALLADSGIYYLVYTAILVGGAMLLGMEAVEPLVLVSLLIGLLYWPVMHASRAQATLGKAIVGLKVSRLDGRRISFLRALWREIAKVFSAAPILLGFALAALLPRKQGLHDLLSATYVVREGAAHVVPALAIAIVGFAVPLAGLPMLADEAFLSGLHARVEGMVYQFISADMVARPAPPPAPKAAQAKPAPKPAPPAAPVAAKKTEPAPLAKAPEPAPVVAPVKPEAVVTAPVPQAMAAAPAALPAPRAASAAPAAKAAAKPKNPKKPAPTKVAAQPRKAAAPPLAQKHAGGLKYNDLMTAVVYGDADEVSQLLKLGKWADKPDSNGMTPLMVAAEHGDLRTAEVLLRAGANPRLALPLAEKRRHGEMVRLLKRY